MNQNKENKETPQLKDNVSNEVLCHYSNSKTKKDSAKVAWELIVAVIGVAVAIIALGVSVVSLVVSINTYEKRYDADATAAGGIEFTFAANGKDTSAGSFTPSCGNLTYGYFQKSGTTPTKYTLSYKKSTSKNYSNLKSLTVYSNNDYEGTYNLIKVNKSEKYDIRCVKNSQKSSKSVFEFDWGIG